MNINRKIISVLLTLLLICYVYDTYGQQSAKKFLLKSTPDLAGWSDMRSE
ncbi:MAG TPA: hypothetical protein VMW95_06700 [Desulfobacterales bacterium]|nr:hypothetical protein [Desulfobacterales bacterium]